jgi:hypothetical protein
VGLIGRLGEYDGRTVEVLERIRDRGAPSEGEVDQAIGLASGPDGKLAAGATWLLRAWLEAGQVTLSAAQWTDLADRLPDVGDTWARVHVAQTIRTIEVPPHHVPVLAGVLALWREADRPFLRAWATDALVCLARDHSEVRPTARRALRAAHADPAASVRARARRLGAEGGVGD